MSWACQLTWLVRHEDLRGVGTPTPDNILLRCGCTRRLRWDRLSRISALELAAHEPVYGQVHESEYGRCGVEHGEVELLPKTPNVGGQRHGRDDVVLEAAFGLFRIGVVEVGERPRLLGDDQ